MKFAENLTKLMQEHDLSNKRLGNAIGVSDSTVHTWRHGDKVPTIEKLQRLSEYFNVSTDELMGISIPTEREIQIPLVGVVNAGVFFNEPENDYYSECLRTINSRMLYGRRPSECVLLEVTGKSMEPMLFEKDILVVHKQSTIVNGNIGIIRSVEDNGFTVKKFVQSGDVVELVPFNSNYRTMSFDLAKDDLHLEVYGVCLAVERKLI